MTSPTDHLVFATDNLKEGIEQIEEMLSVPAVMGGRHPDMGTCNAHVAVGPQCYIEIIAPDPEQPDFQGARPFGIGQHKAARLVTWAARRNDLSQFVQSVRAKGIHLSDPLSMSRITPEGKTLTWKLSFQPESGQEDISVLPFFIDWGGTEHPASRCDKGATLLKLNLKHPEPEKVANIAKVLELDAIVSSGAMPKITAHIMCPRGEVVLS